MLAMLFQQNKSRLAILALISILLLIFVQSSSADYDTIVRYNYEQSYLDDDGADDGHVSMAVKSSSKKKEPLTIARFSERLDDWKNKFRSLKEEVEKTLGTESDKFVAIRNEFEKSMKKSNKIKKKMKYIKKRFGAKGGSDDIVFNIRVDNIMNTVSTTLQLTKDKIKSFEQQKSAIMKRINSIDRRKNDKLAPTKRCGPISTWIFIIITHIIVEALAYYAVQFANEQIDKLKEQAYIKIKEEFPDFIKDDEVDNNNSETYRALTNAKRKSAESVSEKMDRLLRKVQSYNSAAEESFKKNNTDEEKGFRIIMKSSRKRLELVKKDLLLVESKLDEKNKTIFYSSLDDIFTTGAHNLDVSLDRIESIGREQANVTQNMVAVRGGKANPTKRCPHWVAIAGHIVAAKLRSICFDIVMDLVAEIAARLIVWAKDAIAQAWNNAFG